MRNRATSLYAMVGSALLLGGLSGCGTAEYESRLNASVQQLQQGSAFAGMLAPRAISGTPVSIRLPEMLSGSPLDPGTDARRLRPPEPGSVPFFAFLKETFEGTVADSAGGKMPFYCYVAVTSTSELGTRDPKTTLQDRIRRVCTTTRTSWEAVMCSTVDGRQIEWSKIRGAGPQDFYYVDPSGAGDYRQMEGVIELYTREEADNFIVIGWRVPAAIEEHVGLAEWAPKVAGTLSVQ